MFKNVKTHSIYIKHLSVLTVQNDKSTCVSQQIIVEPILFCYSFNIVEVI